MHVFCLKFFCFGGDAIGFPVSYGLFTLESLHDMESTLRFTVIISISGSLCWVAQHLWSICCASRWFATASGRLKSFFSCMSIEICVIVHCVAFVIRSDSWFTCVVCCLWITFGSPRIICHALWFRNHVWFKDRPINEGDERWQLPFLLSMFYNRMKVKKRK